jgi:hypothetical protein
MMCRAAVRFGFLVFSSVSAFSAVGQPRSSSVPRWEIYARCAAAYEANWQLRRSVRAPDMSNMIHEQAEDYKTKAMKFYESDLKAAAGDARQRVDAYLAANVEEFIAMEKAGTLEAYIDQCPPD